MIAGADCRSAGSFLIVGSTSGRGRNAATSCSELALGLVSRCLEPLMRVLDCQMRCAKSDGSERQRATGELLQNERKSPRCTSGLDAPVGRVFRQAQQLRAIREERRATFRKIQSSCIKLHQRANQPRRRPALVIGQALYFDESGLKS